MLTQQFTYNKVLKHTYSQKEHTHPMPFQWFDISGHKKMVGNNIT